MHGHIGADIIYPRKGAKIHHLVLTYTPGFLVHCIITKTQGIKQGWCVTDLFSMQFLDVQGLLCIGSLSVLNFQHISHGEGKLSRECERMIPYLGTMTFTSFYFDSTITDYLILKTQGSVRIIYDRIYTWPKN